MGKSIAGDKSFDSRLQNRRTILLVEDNDKLREIIRRALEKKDYAVYVAPTLGEARERLSSLEPDVILLDVLLPDGSGFDFCEEIRAMTKAHILFLTSSRQYEDKLRGLMLGGDDYITKPFKLNELYARVEAAMRRRDMSDAAAELIVKGILKLDIIAGQALIKGSDLLLSQKEFALLLLFVQNKDKLLGADYLYERVWGQPMNEDSQALRKAVSRIRSKLTGSGYTISSEYGTGYRFEGVDLRVEYP